MKQELVENLKNAKEIILYGASSSGARVFYNLLFMNIDPKIISFYDSNFDKHNTEFCNRPVIDQETFFNKNKDILIIISSSIWYEITKFLKERGFNNHFHDHGLIYSNKDSDRFDSKFRTILSKITNISNVDWDELYTLYSSCKVVSNIEGDIAEIGVYRGGSAYLLAETMPSSKTIYLFDTFCGLPVIDKDKPESGWLSNTSKEEVVSLVSSTTEKKKLVVKEGFFPETAKNMDDAKFSLIHLDTDLYQTTIDALNFFYPKLVSGGRIISHDYNCVGCPGVKKAFKEFLDDNDLNHLIVEVAESQVLLIKP